MLPTIDSHLLLLHQLSLCFQQSDFCFQSVASSFTHFNDHCVNIPFTPTASHPFSHHHPNRTTGTMPDLNLPSIQFIRRDIAPCDYQTLGCRQEFGDVDALRAHNQNCPFRQRQLRHDSVFSFQRVAHSLHLNTQLASPPSSPSDSDSDAVFTPNVSRASSICHSQPPSRRPSLASQPRRHQPSTATGRNADKTVNKKVKKTTKEKESRAQQAAVLCRQEDVLRCYFSWSRQEQSAGNGASAGISINKINLQRVIEQVCYRAIDREFRRAAAQGRLAEFKQEMQQEFDAAIENEVHPYEGTLMELRPGEQACDHSDTKQKACPTHGEADWVACRRRRNEATFARNEDVMFNKMGITKDQAYFGSTPGQF